MVSTGKGNTPMIINVELITVNNRPSDLERADVLSVRREHNGGLWMVNVNLYTRICCYVISNEAE